MMQFVNCFKEFQILRSDKFFSNFGNNEAMERFELAICFRRLKHQLVLADQLVLAEKGMEYYSILLESQ